jgi:chromosomal replication initiator protein
MEALWSAALPLLRQHVGDRNFTAWIEPIRYHGANGEVRLEVPSRFFQAWVTRHFLSTIRDTVSELSGSPCTVRVVVGSDAAADRRQPPTAPAPPTAPPTRALRTPKIGRLVADYTFETFVVGAANEVAFQAAQAVNIGARQALQSRLLPRRRRSREDPPDQRHRARTAATPRAYADRVPFG